MLGKIATAGQNGQFRTPRHIIRLMVELTAPQPTDLICDPACGTAGFLVAAGEYLRERQPNILHDGKLRGHFHQRMFHGFDFDNTMLRIGSMNMLLHGVENPDIRYRDSLAQDHAADHADCKFLWFQLNDERRWHRSGTGQPFIKPSDVKAHRVFLPPFPEQRRIAGVLDTADALRAKRRAALGLLDTLHQAIFLDVFGDPGTNPNGWPKKVLGELISVGPQNGLYKPASDYGSGTPILRIDAFYDGMVTKLASLKRVRISVSFRQARVGAVSARSVI